MSEQEKQCDGSGVNSAIVVVDQETDLHKHPYRPTELKEDSEIHQKRPKTLISLSIEEELKPFINDSVIVETANVKDQLTSLASDKYKQSVAKKLSSNTARREHSPESITLATMELESKKNPTSSLPPIPPMVMSTDSEIVKAEKVSEDQKDEGSINEEIAELQSVQMAKGHSEWSDDEEAGGLPRSDSRTSRVSQMVRQLFCCGVAYDAPSEDNISTHPYLLTYIQEKRNILEVKKTKENMIYKDLVSKTSDQRATIAPFYKSKGTHEGPSGILICLPKKSSNCVIRPSGININISRRCILNRSHNEKDGREAINDTHNENSDKVNCNDICVNFVDTIKGKLSDVKTKVQNIFHM